MGGTGGTYNLLGGDTGSSTPTPAADGYMGSRAALPEAAPSGTGTSEADFNTWMQSILGVTQGVPTATPENLANPLIANPAEAAAPPGFHHEPYPTAPAEVEHIGAAPPPPPKVEDKPVVDYTPTSFADPRGLSSNPTRQAEILAAGPNWVNNNELVRSVLQDVADRGGDWRATSVSSPGPNNWSNPILQYLQPGTKIYWPGDPDRAKVSAGSPATTGGVAPVGWEGYVPPRIPNPDRR